MYEVILLGLCTAGLARFARLRGGKGWPWGLAMVVGYFVVQPVGVALLGVGPYPLVGMAFVGFMFGVVFLAVGRGRRLRSSWQCPVCEFWNDPTTLVCPCGYRVER